MLHKRLVLVVDMIFVLSTISPRLNFKNTDIHDCTSTTEFREYLQMLIQLSQAQAFSRATSHAILHSLNQMVYALKSITQGKAHL